MLYKKIFFLKINRLGFHLWIVNVVEFWKSKNLPFPMCICLFLTLWWCQNISFEGYQRETPACREIRERHKSAKKKVRVIADAFHFKSDEPAVRIFRLGRFARAFGRRGFLFLFSHSHIHSRKHTGGAFKLYVQ